MLENIETEPGQCLTTSICRSKTSAWSTMRKTGKVVKTHSFMQLREPIYNTSVNRWQHYAKYLSEMARMLDASIDVKTG